MTFKIKPLPFKPHRLNGLSYQLLESHYVNHYGGVVKHANAIETQLAGVSRNDGSAISINSFKREQLIATNSITLHELYFDSIGDNTGGWGEPSGELAEALVRDFGSVKNWFAEFSAMGKALANGSGWVLLVWSPGKRRLLNQCACDHTQCLAGGEIMLALDMYEHAYQMDFGANANAYVDAFMQNIHWQRISSKFTRASKNDGTTTDFSDTTEISVEELRESFASNNAPLVLDVRLEDDLGRCHDRISDSTWQDSTQVAQWARTLPRDKPVVVYCLYGFWVSQDTTAALRQQGIDARTLSGGIAAWQALGGETQSLPAG